MASRKVCGKCRARSGESRPRAGATNRGREGHGPQNARDMPKRELKQWQRGTAHGTVGTAPGPGGTLGEDPVPWQLQHMAITCEDAVRRIDELCAVTQHLLKELDVYGWDMEAERSERKDAWSAESKTFQAVPILPQRETEPLREPPSITSPSCVPEPHPSQLNQSLSAYCPPPLGTRSVMLPCDRCIDLDAFSSQFSPITSAQRIQRRRIAEELHSGQLHQRLCAIYGHFQSGSGSTASSEGLTWSRGRLRDFVRKCFAELSLQSPTEPQIYEVYSHFDPELRLGSLTPLESICLSETLLRATFHTELAESEAVPSMSASDHPSRLAERWVEDYVPLPVDGTVSIAYSTGVVIQFSEFIPLIQPLAVANTEHRERMLQTISSCQLLKSGLQIFQRFDSGTGYLSWPSEIMRFILEIFGQEGYVPASQQHVAPFFKKFGQGKSKLNTSECLCLLDAICRAILHCGSFDAVSVSDVQVQPEQRLHIAQGVKSQVPQAHPAEFEGSMPEFTAMTNEVNELLVAKEIDGGELPKVFDEPKALSVARGWVENAAKDLPFFPGNLEVLELICHGGHSGPQQFASMALRVYCEHFAGKEQLYYRGSHEVHDFVQAVFQSGVTRSGRVVTIAMSAVEPVAEHIDLNNLGYLDITQCLLLVDGVLRWILTHQVQDSIATATTSSLPCFGESIFLQQNGEAVGGEEGSPPQVAARDTDASQVYREAFAACDQGHHGYLTWSEVKHFVVMVFRTLGTTPPSESDVYKLYARFDEEHTARLSLAQCMRLADAAVHGLGSPSSVHG